jgi:nucleoside-diphosphate-sugar epimerase/GT2 family glycosyltransferase
VHIIPYEIEEYRDKKSTLRYDTHMKKTFLILGSSGQIGSALTERIKKNGDKVIEFDICNSPEEDMRIYGNSLLEKAVKDADFIFFLAFDVGGSRYLKTYQNTYDFVSNNIKIIDRTFDLINIYHKPFIFASSQMANMSYSSYGLLKSLGEKVTEILGGVVVKFWNVYGVETDLEKSHVITDLIIKAKTKGEIDLLTDGTEERQFLYADDCCECLLTLVDQYGTIVKDKPLHVTSFKWHTVLEVADYIAEHFPGVKIIPSKQIDDVQKNKRNEPDPYILTFWKPSTDLKDGISTIVKAMKSRPELYFPSSNTSPNKISVITHCDNQKLHLKHFLKELPKQTLFKRLEIVLYHTSPDAEEISWISEFNKKYANVIKHVAVKSQDSLGYAMNQSLAHATGEFITIWNVDDVRTPNSIEQQVQVLEQHKAGGVGNIGFTFGDYILVNTFGQNHGRVISNPLVISELTRSMLIGPFFMFRKSLLKKVGMFDEQLKSGADFDFAIRLAFHSGAVRTAGILGYYYSDRMRIDSLRGKLQALERTVIELRYGIYDKIDYDYTNQAEKEYDINQIKIDGKLLPVSLFVPNYVKLLATRKTDWYQSGKMKYSLKKATGYKPLRNLAARTIKKTAKIFK